MHWKPEFGKIDERQRQVIKSSVESIQSKKGIHTIPWISGYAGNGKSVVLIYILENIADQKPSASIAFITYTNALKDLVKASLLPKHQNRVEVMTHTSFLTKKESYDYVFVDEIQDLTAAHLQSINKYAGRVVYAGDFAQTIYPDKSPISESNLEELFDIEEHKLTKMYRLTKKVASIVGKLIKNAFSFGLETGLQKEIPIRFFRFGSQDEEFEWLWGESQNFSKVGQPSAILFPSSRSISEFLDFIAEKYDLGRIPSRMKGPDPYQKINEYLSKVPEEVSLQYFGKGSGSDSLTNSRNQRYVFLTTYYSAKGLDFRAVFVPSLTPDLWLATADAKVVDPEIESKVLFVALTRCREALFLSYSGNKPHKLVAKLGLEPVDYEAEDF
jgi:superfamily I DNA/RNA helicase